MRASPAAARRWGKLSRLFGRSDTGPARTSLSGGRGRPERNRSWAGRRVRMTPRYARRHADTTSTNRTVRWCFEHTRTPRREFLLLLALLAHLAVQFFF